MNRTTRTGIAITAATAAITLTASPAPAAQATAVPTLTRVADFGPNPTDLHMYVYVPARVAPRPALLVALHYCTGSAQAFFDGGAHDFVTAADQYGYIVVFPESTRDGRCFDVSSPQALTRDGGSDPVGIVSMVRYARRKYGVDP